MKTAADLWKNEHGLSLIELLAVLAVSGIVLTVFYNVFIMGIKTYEKTGVEVQLRDEADYVLSDLLDVLDQSRIDNAELCSAEQKGIPCLRFTQNKVIKNNNGIFLEQNNSETITTTFIFDKQVKKITNNNGKLETVFLTQAPYELILPNNPLDSANIICLEQSADETKSCKSGLVEMTIQIQDANFSADKHITVKPMTLKSQFGF
ncbi:prepilin-type N-terminal cleavage/methylation domain-containing protein [Metabacillus sp. KIGAM252]|uniref:Prepilin-type N-terminal cleavage/methylation domain-containing protein n=1 Tax=Metabacillus flavus TaxID=2823519 RepID=A0ABS5LGP2_9BACI|nr:prepilin-type N-terminal cleavage/methylation domain-containing protein [Metabacillus flavus]MBS2969896.1 prepilin-type N-terminal cleavage/methylation domain-containing protein [Metabacillus flavus]